ncbi:hypothetical protein [Sinorhizobium fredii]|uniref:hypothetical protein n=1 Tax=Rhizobium fredii TaxID=380 RepID=UPI001294B28E|nr:hypothetical protein [Sinorhizobium fredii]MQW94060.1 hypothetical protein [Sinorhizobium fredii]
MAIVFAGGELDAFEYSPGLVHDNGNFNSTFARAAVKLDTSSSWFRARFPSIPTIWASWRYVAQSGGTSTGMTLFEAGGPEGAIARVITATSSTAKLQRWDGVAWVDVGAAFSTTETAFVVSSPQTMAVKIDATAGFIRFYRGGVLMAEFVGNTATRAGMTGCSYMWFGARSSSNISYISEVIVGDTDNRLYRLVTLPATGNGANTAWANDYLSINAYNSPDSSFISSGGAGEKESFALGNLPAATADTGEVKAVVVSARHNIQSASGPQTINALVRTGGADHTTALSPQNKDAFGGAVAVWNTNPATGQKWTRTEVDALEAGMQSAA